MMDRLAQLVPAEAIGTWCDALPSVAPGNDSEWSAVINAARSEGWSCAVVGSDSKLSRRRGSDALEGVDLALSTQRTAGVIAYEPGDGTLTAHAGTSMAELEAVGRAGGHHVTPDVARPDNATLGGVLGDGCSGFERLRYGPARHNVLGMRVLLADGSITKTGGRLVKNVTGYDLHRLYTGARGALCVILEATLRLYPLPTSRACLRMRFDSRAEALAGARGVLDAAVRPAAVIVRDAELQVFLVGRDEVVEWEIGCVRGHGPEPEEVATAEAERALRESARDFGPTSTPSLRVTTRPSLIARALDALDRAAAATKLDPDIQVEPGLAAALIRFERAGGEQVRAFQQELGKLNELPAQLEWRNAPWVSAIAQRSSAAASLVGDLKAALDPSGVFHAGKDWARV